ncbi:hypothetical protein [Paenibacillus favisporus]|nr:hypothetical protein [Paenibacillus favisporus]
MEFDEGVLKRIEAIVDRSILMRQREAQGHESMDIETHLFAI